MPKIRFSMSGDPSSGPPSGQQSGAFPWPVLDRPVRPEWTAAAIRAEKAMHSAVSAALPDAVIDADRIAGRINVRSEVYHPTALPMIHRLLDSVAAQGGQAA